MRVIPAVSGTGRLSCVMRMVLTGVFLALKEDSPMKPVFRSVVVFCVLSFAIFFFLTGSSVGADEERLYGAVYAVNAGPGQVELEGGSASRGWPGVRPRYHYPPYYRYPPHHPYPPYYYHPHPQYERERTWYEGDLPTSAGRLFFLAEPVQAEAFINGYPLTRHADLSFEISLLKGEHQLEVHAEGYEPYHRTIEIRGGEQIRLTIRLER